jgi:sigma-E factor negative regulatory protein RseC
MSAIIEQGHVCQVADGKAVVEIQRGSACSKCHADCACSGDETQLMRVEVRDPIGVHIDQCVQLSIENTSVLRASFVVYMVPLFALITGVLAGKYLGQIMGVRDLLEILCGFGALGLSLIIVRLYNNAFQRDIRNQPVITKIIG